MKSRNNDFSKSSSKNQKYKEDSEELTTEEITDKTISEESESESERKR